jgi:hypothetical protein
MFEHHRFDTDKEEGGRVKDRLEINIVKREKRR